MDTSTEPQITKRRVTMTSVVAAGKDDEGRDLFHRYEAVDYVRPDQLDAYVADAKTRWQHVEVSDEPDAGPGGYHGSTAELDHSATPEGEPPAVVGITPATPGSERAAAEAAAADQPADAGQEG